MLGNSSNLWWQCWNFQALTSADSGYLWVVPFPKYRWMQKSMGIQISGFWPFPQPQNLNRVVLHWSPEACLRSRGHVWLSTIIWSLMKVMFCVVFVPRRPAEVMGSFCGPEKSLWTPMECSSNRVQRWALQEIWHLWIWTSVVVKTMDNVGSTVYGYFITSISGKCRAGMENNEIIQRNRDFDQ